MAEQLTIGDDPYATVKRFLLWCRSEGIQRVTFADPQTGYPVSAEFTPLAMVPAMPEDRTAAVEELVRAAKDYDARVDSGAAAADKAQEDEDLLMWSAAK